MLLYIYRMIHTKEIIADYLKRVNLLKIIENHIILYLFVKTCEDYVYVHNPFL